MTYAKKLCMLLCAAMLLSVTCGCTTRYQNRDITEPEQVRLERGQACYIVVPANGVFEDVLYPDSGKNTAFLLQNALKPYTSQTRISPHTEVVADALRAAGQHNARYVFIPEITHWEQRAARWTGKPSKARIIISVYDRKRTQSGPVFYKELSALGRSATVSSQYVEEIVKPLLEQFVQGIF